MSDAPRPVVLLVDDEEAIRTTLKAILRRAFPTCAVLTAPSGEEALAMLRAQHVDAIISDHHMAPLDGISFLSAAHALAPRTIRFLLTGFADGPTARRAVEQGHIDAFYLKPFESQEIVERLRSLLAERVPGITTARAPSPRMTSAQHEDGQAWAAKTVLVVDDVPEIGAIFRDVAKRLPPRSARVVPISRPSDAFLMIEAEPLAAIVTDYRMPGLSGVDLLIHARSIQPEARRVLITGYNEIPESTQRLAQAGVDAYLHKPLGAQDLQLLLRALISDEADAMEAYRTQARGLERVANEAQRGLTLDE